MKRSTSVPGAAVVVLLLAVASSPTMAIAAPEQEAAALTALDDVAPHVLEHAAELAPGDGGAEAETAAGTVTVPESSDELVQVSSDVAAVAVQLPIAGALLVAYDQGAAVYESVDSVSTIVSPQLNGSVVIATNIEDVSAPTRFDYVYPGLTLRTVGEGDVVGYDANGEIAMFVGVPWAYDAKGEAVSTHYEVDGSTLTQVVNHTDKAYAYPVVADPTLNFGGNSFYTKIVEDRNASTGAVIIRVYPVSQNYSRITNTEIWEKYKAIVPSTYETTTMHDQLICHVRNVGLLKVPWNLEPWRPNVGYVAVVAAGCNPN